ncbi:MAG: AAA family ATPase [Planctomycetales bacterium]|nr:AAA family ATPase [Planctomycetales bacterium]
MYEEYWNVSEKPFENTANSQFYYPSDTHQGALLKLRYAVESSTGGALLTGAPGLGKTLVLQSLLQHLPAPVAPRVNLVFPKMPTDQLLSFIADELAGSQTPRSRTVDESIRTIQSTLQENAKAGRRAMLIVDEAHLLASERTLDTLRLLLNFEYEGKPCLTLILSGQPNLLPVLERHPGLEERMAVKCLLRPFSEDETSSYIQHRIQQAGGSSSVFDQEAIGAIHAISHGVPRKINRLCDLALLIAFAEEQATITAAQIESVSDELITVAPE